MSTNEFESILSNLGTPNVTESKNEKIETDSVTGFAKKIGTIPQVCPPVKDYKNPETLDTRIAAFVDVYNAWKLLSKHYDSGDAKVGGIARSDFVYDVETQKLMTEVRKLFIGVGKDRIARIGANLQAEKAAVNANVEKAK